MLQANYLRLSIQGSGELLSTLLWEVVGSDKVKSPWLESTRNHVLGPGSLGSPLWLSAAVALRCRGSQMLWLSAAVALSYCGPQLPWLSDAVALSCCGSQLWLSATMALSCRGSQMPWLSAAMALRCRGSLLQAGPLWS